MTHGGREKQAEERPLRVESAIAVYYDRREQCYVAQDVHFGLGSSAPTMAEAVEETIQVVRRSLLAASAKGELQSYLKCRRFILAGGRWAQAGDKRAALQEVLTGIAQELASAEHAYSPSSREPDVDVALRLHHYNLPMEEAVAAGGA